jgi:hypothetical protein
LTGKFDLTNVNNMAFYISGPKLLFETTEISTHPNSTQQESNYIYLYTTKFGTSIKIRLNRKFESTEFETMRVNCTFKQKISLYMPFKDGTYYDIPLSVHTHFYTSLALMKIHSGIGWTCYKGFSFIFVFLLFFSVM